MRYFLGKVFNNSIKMKNYKLIIFDWDGTLFDSGSYIVRCFQQTAQELDVELAAEKVIRNSIGMNLDYALDWIVPNLPKEKIDPFIRTFHYKMENNVGNGPGLFDGAKDVLQQLHMDGYLLAIATGKRRSHLAQDLSNTALSSLFLSSRCGDETFSKPNPQMVLEILGELAMKPNEALMIGDTEYDMQAGLNAGTDVIGVSYGMHTEAALRKHAIQHCLSDIRELSVWLARYGK